MHFQAPESLSEQIAQHLGARIIRSQLKPGERIQELKISKELEVSRGSVREALLILQRRHLVDIFPRKGAVVSALTPALVECLYDVYVQLLTMLIVKLAENWKESDLYLLTNKISDIEVLVNSQESKPEALIDSGFELMQGCFTVVRNPFLEEALLNYRSAVSRTYYLVLTHGNRERKETLRFFNALAEAVQVRNRYQVVQLIEEYASHQRQLVLDVLAKQN